jgi:hypothetical protein
MFVPSLSWQNDHFYIKNGAKVPFSHLLRLAQGFHPRPNAANPRHTSAPIGLRELAG